ncbi:three-Cys-motif partner protein TcmP [Streptomyces sp. NPDC050738]|uniref:three-Cys-motif partner protein TcmP n=1 Tax=Streptomyces sp. NPDC050738 TaxID=3154744 RepID=UPI003445F040
MIEPEFADGEELLLSGESAGEEVTDATRQFFVSKKAAALLKHEILQRYVKPFAAKVGRWAPGGRVVYLDGYAGPGRYEDGTPGSPALILDSAAEVASIRQLDCYFIERRRADYRRLDQLVSEARGRGLTAEALSGKVEKHLSYVLEQAQGAPLLAFIDPFGLGLSFDALTTQLFGSREPAGATGRDATEVLLNFNANAVRRIGGLLTSTKEPRGKQATLQAMDAACGGDWWRDEFLDSADNREAVERIAGGFAQRVGAAVRAHSWTLPVRNREHHQPAYHLVLFSRHRDGLWLFGEAISHAQAQWRREILPPSRNGTLFDESDLFEQEEEQRARGWIDEIKRNILGLLQQRAVVGVDRYHEEIMGSALGEARQMHIRAAIKELHKDGRTACDGKGSIPSMRITRPTIRR